MQKSKTEKNTEIFNIAPCLIKPNPSLSRTDFSDMSLFSLADSIKRYGILQPLAVRISENGRYELIAGERRLRAALMLHLPTVPCILLKKDEKFEYLSVVENLHREKLTMFDEARAIKRIYEKNGRNTEKVARLLSMGETELKRKLRLCEFTRAEMQAIISLGTDEKTSQFFLDLPSRIRYYTIKLCAEKGYTYAETKLLCEKAASASNLFPDDLEIFANNIINSQKCEFKSAESPKETSCTGRATIVLKDLRVFEISLRKICAILENAGFETKIRTIGNDKEFTYTVTVDINKKTAEE